MQINLKEAMKWMPDQEVCNIAEMAKNELRERLARDSVYEPTGISERDEEHYRKLQALRKMIMMITKL